MTHQIKLKNSREKDLPTTLKNIGIEYYHIVYVIVKKNLNIIQYFRSSLDEFQALELDVDDRVDDRGDDRGDDRKKRTRYGNIYLYIFNLSEILHFTFET